MASNRRSFMRQSVKAAAFATIATHSFPVFGANERIQAGFLGIGIRGNQLLNYTLKETHDKVRVVAVCDAYTGWLKRAADTVSTNAGNNPAQYSDFRRMLDDKNVEAVVIATPEHRHVEHVLMALAAGKDVYVEKR